MKTSLDFIISFLTAVASGLFLAGITSFSPIYFLFIVAIMFFFLRHIIVYNINFSYFNIFVLFIFIYSIITQLLIPNTKFSNILGLALPYLFFFVFQESIKTLTKKQIVSISISMIISQIIVITFDTIWRFSHPTLYATNIYTGDTRELNLAYMFKFNSIMYLDANFVGVQTCLLYFFSLFLFKEKYKVKYIKIILIILFSLIILTTSRSAIIVTIVFTLIFRKISFPFYFTKNQIKLMVVVGLITTLLGSGVFIFLSKDASFLTKFLILELAIEFLKNVPINTMLFGVGMGNTFNFIGIGAHNLIVTLTLESGLIGLFLFSFFVYLITKKTNYKALYILLPFFLMGFSVVSIAFPYLLCQLVIIYNLGCSQKSID